MARLQLHLGLLFSSPLSHHTSVDLAAGEEIESETESGSSPPIVPAKEMRSRDRRGHHFSILATATAAAASLRRSLATCSLGSGEEGTGASMDISWPTDVQHISHVTFNRFDGFLGLPVEFQPDIPSKVPSASVSVFGVSAESMHCSHDSRGNSVPTILLSMQRHLYSQGGLKEEGIFRINAENQQEMLAREQLNKGVVPQGVDLHCLAGLIKAWLRELPRGVLYSVTAEQLMYCNTKGDCSHVVRMLPATEAGLFDWAINLMADVVEHQHHNKMNSRNIAMLFAPNMTQMDDPLLALIHAVQMMNFLNTLIKKTLHDRDRDREREQSITTTSSHNSFSTAADEESDSASNDSFQSFEADDHTDFISGSSKTGYANFYAQWK